MRGDGMSNLAGGINLEILDFGNHAPEECDVDGVILCDNLLDLLGAEYLTIAGRNNGQLGQACDLAGGQKKEGVGFRNLILLFATRR
jgi:hypothetical protein